MKKSFIISGPGLTLYFQLSLVDLAGSERVAKTGATAEQLKVSIVDSGLTQIQTKITCFIYHI